MEKIKEGVVSGAYAIKKGARRIKSKIRPVTKKFLPAKQCKIIDIDEKVLQEAEELIKKNPEYDLIDLKDPDIDWSTVKCIKGTPTTSFDKFRTEKLIVYSNVYVNDTYNIMKCELKSSKKTRNSTDVSFSQGLRKDGVLEVHLGEACGVHEAGGVLAVSQDQLRSGTMESRIEETDWSLDQTITIPSKSLVEATHLIKEESFEVDFSQMLTYDGFAKVTYKSKEDKRPIIRHNINVRELLLKDAGFHEDGRKRPCYLTKGKVKANRGFGQELILKEFRDKDKRDYMAKFTKPGDPQTALQ